MLVFPYCIINIYVSIVDVTICNVYEIENILRALLLIKNIILCVYISNQIYHQASKFYC